MGSSAETLSATHETESKAPQTVPAGAAPQASGLEEVLVQRFASGGDAGSALRHAGHPVMRSASANGVRAMVMRQAQHNFGNRALATQLRRSSALIQRECSCGGTCSACQQAESPAAEEPKQEEESKLVQRQATGKAAAEVDARVIPANSPGHPLDERTRGRLENRLGGDLSEVRVHTDGAAAESATALQANAYTVGRDIYFAAGQYSPGTTEGTRLLAHEAAHTLQQGGESSVPMTSHKPGVALVGDVDDPLEREAEEAADGVVRPEEAPGENSPGHPPVVRRSFSDFAGSVWDATGGKVVAGAERAWQGAKQIGEDLWDEAKEVAAAFIERIAPGLVGFLSDVGGALFERIAAGVDSALGGLSSRIENQGLGGAIAGLLGELFAAIGKAAGGLAVQSCQSQVAAVSAVVDFIKRIGGWELQELGKIAGAVGHFFSTVWTDYGAPALAAIQKFAGAAWKWITEKAAWVWDLLKPIREASSRAWNWIKDKFNLAKDEASGALDWLYDKAKEVWFKIRDKLAPVIAVLKVVGAALVIFSPLGPVILIWKGAPYLWKALQWIWANGVKPLGAKLRDEFREHILPTLMAGVDEMTVILDQATNFFCEHGGAIADGLKSLQEVIGGIPFLGLAARAVGAVAGFFANLATKGKCRFSDVIGAVKRVLRRIYDFVKPILELLRQAVLVATLGPWAILDDGVWHTLNQFVAFAQRTPCFREIAGLMHLPGVMAKVGEIRNYLKDVWEVVSNQDKFEKAIHNALDGLLALVPGKVEAIAGAMMGLDGPHLHALLTRFLAPKLASVVGHWKDMLINVVWDLVWPWPGVIKDVEETGKKVDDLKSALWDFEFSKASDACLAIWRGINGIVGHLYGWFFLAAVLIGAIFASPQAGAAVAYEVGEILLFSTLAAEGLTIEKSKWNLMAASRLAMTGPKREKADDEDYENMSGSIVNLAILGVMSVLGELAADFAKAVFAEIKNIFLPESAEAPAARAKVPGVSEGAPPPHGATTVDTPVPGEGAGQGEAVRTPEVKTDKPVTDTGEAPKAESDSPAKAEDLARSKEAARKALENPENIRPVKDPAFSDRYDVEVEADGHTFRRDKESGTWCRFTVSDCGLDLGPKATAAADAAAAQQARALFKPGATAEEVASFINQVAEKTGKSVAEIDRFLRLAKEMGPEAEALAKSITDAVKEGRRMPNGAREQLDGMLDRLRSPRTKADRALGDEANKQYLDPLTGEPLTPGDPAHKAQRWAEYQQRNRLTPKEAEAIRPEWEKRYDSTVRMGSAAEREGLARARVTKNNAGLVDPKSGEVVIPDGVRGNPAKLEWGQPYDMVEVKYWEYLSQTGNVLSMLEYIEKFGGTMELWLKGGSEGSEGTELSGPMQRLIARLNRAKPGTVNVKRFNIPDAVVAQPKRKEPCAECSGVTPPVESEGEPLDAETRVFMEGRLDHNFGDVRIHTDAAGAQSAEAIHAEAYAAGRDIYFAAGMYSPSTPDGRRLIAHELAHTVQRDRRDRPASVAPANGHSTPVSRPDDALEGDADRTAAKASDPAGHGGGPAHQAAKPAGEADAAHQGDDSLKGDADQKTTPPAGHDDTAQPVAKPAGEADAKSAGHSDGPAQQAAKPAGEAGATPPAGHGDGPAHQAAKPAGEADATPPAGHGDGPAHPVADPAGEADAKSAVNGDHSQAHGKGSKPQQPPDSEGSGSPPPAAHHAPATIAPMTAPLPESAPAPPARYHLPPIPAPEPPVLNPVPDLMEAAEVSPAQAAALASNGYNAQLAADAVGARLDQFRDKAEALKERVRNCADAAKTNLAQSAAEQRRAIHSQMARSLHSVKARIDATRGEIAAEAVRVKLSAITTSTGGFLGVLANTAKHVKHIENSGETHKRKAPAAIEAERQAVRKFGADEGLRGRHAVEEQAFAADQKGNAKASLYPDTDRGQAQVEAVLKVGSEVARSLAKSGPDFQSSAAEAGKQLAIGIVDMGSEFAKSVDAQVPKIVGELWKQAVGLEPQFEGIGHDAIGAVETFAAEANRHIDRLEHTLSRELAAIEANVEAQLAASSAAMQSAVDSRAAAAISAIERNVATASAAVRRIKRPYVDGIDTAITASEVELGGFVAGLTADIGGSVEVGRAGLADAISSTCAHVATMAASVIADLAHVRRPAVEGLRAIEKKAQEGSNQLGEAWETALRDIGKAVDAKYDEAIAGLVAEIRKDVAAGKAKLTSQIDEAVAKNGEPLTQLDSSLEEAAKAVRDKYDAPWYKKVGRWVWNALGAILKILWGVLKLVWKLVWKILGALFIMFLGIAFGIEALFVLGALALVAFVGKALYDMVTGFAQNFYARVKSADSPLQAFWAGVVGLADITGIPGFVEGIIKHDIVNGRELTEEEAEEKLEGGVLAIILMLLGGGEGGAPEPVEVPVEIPLETGGGGLAHDIPGEPAPPPDQPGTGFKPDPADPAPPGDRPAPKVEPKTEPPVPKDVPRPVDPVKTPGTKGEPLVEPPAPHVDPKIEPPVPKDAPRPVDPVKTPGAKGEPHAPDAPETRVPEPESHTPPKELARSEEAARQTLDDPANLSPVEDPEFVDRYDVEGEADGHMWRRDRSTRTWCRFSARDCGADLGSKVGAAADAAAAEEGSALFKPGATAKQVGNFVKKVAKHTGEDPVEIDRFLRLAKQMGPEAEALAKDIADAVREGRRLPNGAGERLSGMLERLRNPRTLADRAIGAESARLHDDPFTGEPLAPGSAGHKAQRWAEYQQRKGLTPEEAEEVRESWENRYEATVAMGSAAEKQALGEAGITKKNTAALKDPVSEQSVIPDGVRENPKTLQWGDPYDFVEVKYWEYLSATGNALKMLQYIDHFGGTLELWVRGGAEATEFSQPMMALIYRLNRAKPKTVTIKMFTLK